MFSVFFFKRKVRLHKGSFLLFFQQPGLRRKLVARKRKRLTLTTKVRLFGKRCLPDQWQWFVHLCYPVWVCPLMARWDYFGFKAKTIVACFPQALQNPFWFPAQTNQSKTWRKAFCCLHLGQWVSSFFNLISTSTFVWTQFRRPTQMTKCVLSDGRLKWGTRNSKQDFLSFWSSLYKCVLSDGRL